ncbi:hypothetical protein ESCO_005948 [Escovopsis weberi]|uniref:Uncharacterized protein n=1 Tax=Escovopsis weberi TaxID=150374 RepID=A0A0M8MUH8_ESCWE|nr:hypothetical protein ESCO_005948 [Escovopsis weberi]
MAFLEDPRLRQRWNQIAHDAETVTENAAAGIWNFQQNYINPCLGSVKDTIDQCTTVCLGDPEERLRRQRERARERAEDSFNFYDDWDRAEEGGGLLGNWRGEDWDRLLAGSGSQRRHEVVDQPRKKRGMSYGTGRARRSKSSQQDSTIIPSTQPIGFLNRLPWSMGRPLRYKPSAADLQDHPGVRRAGYGTTEAQPLLGADDDDSGSDEDDSDYDGSVRESRCRHRSGTTGSGGTTSDSYRSRGDLFPSDGEGDEDAIPLDGDVTYEMVRKDDRSGRSAGTLSSKGKRPAGFSGSRAVSRTTLGSITPRRSLSIAFSTDTERIPSLHDSEVGGHSEYEYEDEELAGKREELREVKYGPRSRDQSPVQSAPEPKPPEMDDEREGPPEDAHEPRRVQEPKDHRHGGDQAHKVPEDAGKTGIVRKTELGPQSLDGSVFIPARLPRFG